MSAERARTVWEALEERFGDVVRAVVRYDGFEYDAVTRPDVRDRYTDEDARHLVNDVVVNQLILADSEESFQAGRHRAFIRVFDEVWVVIRPDDVPAKTGYLVSFDRDGGEPSFDVGTGVEYLDELVSDGVAHEARDHGRPG
jgi:hypothetical protein